ncbi:MAG TPA: prepilin peptidase [Acetobacteraceae bacterium]
MTLIPASLSLALSAAAVALACASALRDVIARTIPNGWCGAIALLGLASRLVDGTIPAGLLAAAAVFALMAICWRFGFMGGGDVKLLAACALAIPPHLAPALLIDTAMVGALLGVVYLAARNRLPRPGARRPASLLARALRAERWRLSRGGPLPYAVAIAAGMAIVLTGASP